jgi:hypothetical protein
MRTYLAVSGTVFGLVALLHLLRLLRHWPAVIAAWNVPLWASGIGLLAAGSLCVWAFRLAARGSGTI